MRLGDVLEDWQLLQTRPGQYAAPGDLADQWTDAPTVSVPCPVSLSEATDVDDFDWWQRCAFDASEHTTIEFQGGLTFPATVFVDGEPVADVTSMFLPVRVEVECGRHEICVRFGSLNDWLTRRRPRGGRWRSSLVAPRVSVGQEPHFSAGRRCTAISLRTLDFGRPVVVTSTRLRTTFVLRADTTGDITIEGSTTAPEATHVELVVSDPPTGNMIAQHTAVVQAGRFTATARAEDPRLWWPRGYGSQPIYRAAAFIDGQRVAERLFGFRTVTSTYEPRASSSTSTAFASSAVAPRGPPRQTSRPSTSTTTRCAGT